MMTREDDSQHKLSGQQRTSTQRICPQMHYKHAQRADDISGVAVGNAGARFGAGAVQPGNWRGAADQHRNAMSSTERGRMILLRSVLDVGWSAARRTGEKSSSEADERHDSSVGEVPHRAACCRESCREILLGERCRSCRTDLYSVHTVSRAHCRGSTASTALYSALQPLQPLQLYSLYTLQRSTPSLWLCLELDSRQQ